MKINAVFGIKLNIALILVAFLSIITQINTQCNAKFGCLARQKFMAYVTVQSRDGKALPLRTTFNYKVVYVFTDRLVFFTSKDSGSAALESEDTSLTIEDIEAKIERVINFAEILLDCGKYHNKLCHGQEYPGLDKLPSFDVVKKEIQSNADVLCITIPFFENGYQKLHEKIAYICGTAAKDLYNIISFKNFLSRKIEFYQLRMSADRYNAFHGLLKKKGKFITFIEGKPTPVIANFYDNNLEIVKNDQSKEFLQNYSLYQQRGVKQGAFMVNEALKKSRIPANWNDGMSPSPNPECCIYFSGDMENLVLCLAGSDDSTVEVAGDVCKNKLKPFYGETQNSQRGIKFAESFHELVHNKQKLENCKSGEFGLMKWRAEKTFKYAIKVDCKFVMNYITNDDYKSKYTFCKKNYNDELKLELKLMSMDNDSIYDGINTCVYQSTSFSKVMRDDYFDELMKKNKMYKDMGSFMEVESEVSEVEHLQDKYMMSSFMELESESKEVDEFDDDEGDAKENHTPKKQNKKPKHAEDSEINFAEIQSASTRKEGKKKKRDMNDYIYSKPKENMDSAELQKVQIFRATKMSDLQKKHTWTTSPREAIKEKFNRSAASGGKNNADEFISFLGYLRDASSKASKVIAAKEANELAKQKK
jgi:hypothetical protein